MLFYKTVPVTAEDVDRGLDALLQQLPEWRLRYAMKYIRPVDRFLCAKSYMMLCELLSEHYGMEAQPEFSCGENGKPYIDASPQVHFNISHCAAGIICAVGDEELGVDIEMAQFDEGLAKSVLSPDEYQDVISAQRPDVRFAEYWTMKESLLKLYGKGLPDDMRYILSLEDNVSFKLDSDEAAGVVSCIAVKGGFR
ncbi:MAG: 4'-phosphopantetheinyl transferase superfamily protein [Bacteroidia bacterium]|nr:4'-phosphopantetheinyl transferase superfamily protein [Bacteroidia bacterium]